MQKTSLHGTPSGLRSSASQSPFSPFVKEETLRASIDDLRSYKDALVLVVDDDPDICAFVQKAICKWGLKAETITNPLRVLDRVRGNSHKVVLLDVFMPEKSGLDLIPEILDVYPYAKVILMTAYADKEIAINALRLGAFDFLEKPFKLALLRHSVKRALDTQKTELEYKRVREELQKSLDDVMDHKSKLEQLNAQLMETNEALSVLARNIDITRRETRKQIILKIRNLIIPVVEKLQRNGNLEDCHAELNMLGSYVEELSSEMDQDIETTTTLTPSELRIASLIKNGFSTEEIADHLCISSSTVKTHRKNMRKKLNLDSSKQSLRNYLRLQLGG